MPAKSDSRLLIQHGYTPSHMTEDERAKALAKISLGEEAVDAEFVEEPPKKKPAQEVSVTPTPSDPASAISQFIASEIERLGGGQKVDDKRIVELIEKHAVHRVDVTVTTIDGKTQKIEGAHKAFPEVMEWVTVGEPTMMVGPAGSGKTTMARQVATALGRPFFFSGSLTAEHKVLGFENATGDYVPTAFYEAFVEGGVFLLDEFDASMPGAVLTLNAPIANRICDFPIGIVEAHKDWVILAGANTYGRGANREFVGRLAQDGAAIDRWLPVNVDYDEALENALACSTWEAFGKKDDAKAMAWVTRVRGFRDGAEKAGIKHIISPRATVRGAKALSRGNLSRDQIEDACIWKGLDADSRRQIQEAA